VRPSPSVGRVAIVNDVAGVGPLQAEALRQAGWQADFFDLPKPGARWPRWAKLLALPYRLALYVPIAWRLRRGGYDLVHVHFVSQGVVGALSGRPYFLHAHGSDLHLNFASPLMKRWSERWMRGARRIFYVTPNLAEFLESFKGKSQLLPNPIDVDRFRGIPPPERIEAVLIFMRLLEVKGPEVAFAGAVEVADMFSLTAITAGPLAAELENRYGDRVAFIAPVAHDEIPALLAHHQAVIGQMLQGVAGLSELEALAAGRVVLMALDARLYPTNPPPVVDVQSAPQIAQRLRELRDDAAEIGRLSREGRDWVEANHSLRAHAEALIRAYEGRD
jgi:glycosyltransferase involved in cell wall biosynthesis